MKTTEHLEKIKAKLEELIVRYKSGTGGAPLAIAGWKSTLLQIQWIKDDLQSAEEDGDFDCVRALERRASLILAAYPIELLQ
jgi:hypothetical protein